MEFSQKDEGYFSTLERTAQDGSIHDRSSSLENVTAAQVKKLNLGKLIKKQFKVTNINRYC